MQNEPLLIVKLTSLKLALPLAHVVRVVPVLLSKPLPGAPDSVQGVIDLQGEVIPLINLYQVLGIQQSKETELWESLVLVQTSKRKLLLPATQVLDVYDPSGESTFVPASDPQVNSTKIKGILQYADDLLFIQDVEALLSHKEEKEVQEALACFRETSKNKTT